MRILHTSDWHIGRTFHGHATLDHLEIVLTDLVAQVRERDVDVVIVAGDVFDSSMPAAGCYTLLTEILVALRETGARVVVTSGNHDSIARLGFQSALLRDGIHIVTDPLSVGIPITIEDEHGPVHFYGIPYLEPVVVRSLWPDTPMRTQHEAVGHAMDLVRADLADRGGRSLAIAHCFAAGVSPTPQLERDIQQGGLDVVPLQVFDGVDYAALGHIHGRQELAANIRYAGAPLHYSFGEQHKPRGGWIVDLDACGLAAVTPLDLPIPRRLVTLTGPLDELLEPTRHTDVGDAWVCARYTDAAAQSDPMRRLQARFPNCATVIHEPAERVDDGAPSFASRVRTARSDAELIDAFLRFVRNGEGADEAEAEFVREILAERAAAEATA